MIVLASCAVDNRPPSAPRLWGSLRISIVPESLALRVYHLPYVEEKFTCNYELNRDYKEKLVTCGLRVSGVSADGGARIVELPDHRFFLGTGFLPQLSSAKSQPHPLILAFLKAAAK